MENLQLPAYPVIMNGPNFENGYDGFKPGFTKLEVAALMAMQGMIASNFYVIGMHSEHPHMAITAVSIAKAVLEEANK